MVSKYKETEIGSIPEEWDVISLSDAFQNLEAGVSVNSDERQNADFFVLKTSAISDGLINIDEAKPVVKKEYARLKCPVKKGSIIISRMNTPQLVGACGYVAEDVKGYFLPDRLWQVVNSKPEKYDFRWLNYLLNQYRYKNAIHAVATGTSNSMKNISKERLLEIRIPRPSIEEQKFIVEAISDIEALIYDLEKLIKKKRNIFTGTMQMLVTGKKRLDGFSGDWVKINLAKNSRLKARIGWQGLTTDEYLDEGYSYLITGTDFKDGRINWNGCHYVNYDRYVQDPNIQVSNGDLLLTKDGTIGKVAYISDLNRPATLNSGVFVVKPVTDAYTAHFMFYVLESSVFKDFLQQLSAGSTINHLYQKDLVKFDLYVPPTTEEQEAITGILFDMDLDIYKLEEKLSKYQKIKQGMMEELLTGKVRLV